MKVVPLILLLGVALLAPAVHAKTIVFTNAKSGKAVTLVAGDTLIIRLTAHDGGLGPTEWHVVYEPDVMLRLSGSSRFSAVPHPHSIVVFAMGDSTVQEFRFSVPLSLSKESFVKGAWLRFLLLDPFEPGIKGAKVWQIQYTIKATK